MERVTLSPRSASAILEFGSRGAAALPLADGAGDAHVYLVKIEPGGEIGRHPAGFGQLFLVLEGSGWAAGGDGERVALRSGQGAYFARGENHAKGSEAGMTALMIQVRELAPRTTDPESPCPPPTSR